MVLMSVVWMVNVKHKAKQRETIVVMFLMLRLVHVMEVAQLKQRGSVLQKITRVVIETFQPTKVQQPALTNMGVM